MQHHLSALDNWFYAVFERTTSPSDGHGMHVGSVSLRRAPTGPTLAPPATFEGAAEVGMGAVVQEAHEPEDKTGEVCASERASAGDLEMRVLGYAFFAGAQGKGYATEAARGVLGAYKEAVRAWREGEGGFGDVGANAKRVYVEAGVDVENPGSQRVLQKLGFKSVGMKIEKEKVWLNGGWRGPGWWITGQYL